MPENAVIRVEKPLFSSLYSAFRGGHGCFSMRRITVGYGRTTVFKTKGRRCGNGGISHRQDARLHGHVKSSSAQHGIIPESERASVAHAVIAGQLGLHHKGTCPYLQGRRGQYLRRCAGVRGTRVCDPRARPRGKRSARLD